VFVDAHVHIDRFRDPAGVLAAAEAAGVVCLAVTETPRDFEMLRLRAGRREKLRLALGAHPLRASSLSREHLRAFATLVADTDYVGEVGLDGSREGRPSLPQQRRVFEHVLEMSGIHDCVLSVHSRGAEAETIDQLANARVAAILHWYSGALKHAERAVEAGLYFSINAAMLRSQKGMRLLLALPRNRVLTETDGPYGKTAGRAAEPASVPALVADLSGAWSCDPEEARDQVWTNMARIYARRSGATGQPEPAMDLGASSSRQRHESPTDAPARSVTRAHVDGSESHWVNRE
jgi:TatD DNase family protein